MSDSVGQLHIEVNVQLAKMQAQFDDLQRRTKALNAKVNSEFRSMTNGIKAAMSTLGAYLAPAALVAFGKSVINLGSDITDLSNAANVNAQAFQSLSLHFMDSGVTMQELSKAFVMLRKNAQEAVSGNKLMEDSFNALGIDAAKLLRLAPEKQFELIAIAISQAKDQNVAFGAALDILGTKQAPKLIAALKELGVEGLDAIIAKTREWQLSPEQLDTLDKAGDKLGRMAKYAQLLSAQAFLTTLNNIKTNGFVSALTGGPAAGLDGGAGTTSFFGHGSGPAPVNQAEVDAKLAAAAALAKAQADKLAEVAGRNEAATATIRAKTVRDELAMFGKIGDAFKKESLEKTKAIESETERIVDGAYPWKKYQDDIALATKLEKMGRITTDEKTAAIARLQDQIFESRFGKESEVPIDFDYEELTSGMAAVRDSMAQMWNSVSDRAGQAFADMVMTGKASFSTLTDMVARTALEMVARLAIINPLMNAMFGGFGGAGLLPAFFGAGAKVAGARADGGPVSGGQTYLVGEEGPELFTPSASGAIIPNGMTAGAGRGDSFAFTYHIGAGVTREQLLPILRSQERQTMAKIADTNRRG